MNDQNQRQRLRSAIEATGKTQAAVARLLGRQKGTLNAALRGRAGVPERLIRSAELLALALGAERPEWLPEAP